MGVCIISVLETVNGSDPLPFVGYEGGLADNKYPRVIRQETMNIIMLHGLLSFSPCAI